MKNIHRWGFFFIAIGIALWMSVFPCPKDSVIYVVREYGLGVFSERLTVSCPANPRVGKGANESLTPALCFIP